ncbi:Clp protease N-terminal domain-containing protein [Streptomyces sp. 351MFTsu5.1]|uniref:Clp protease N-terminal domain-containing protein n=1 Tax=Streptomyces sp. 351MFTsu5.1 TaxID=1172180 RepID=UPI00036806A5|nr:Clp protease N-terminal domain-containing protein [Streptomyces sp. 351MFTsu5.1]
MHPRIPRQSARDQGRPPQVAPDGDATLSAELAAVVSGARRRALRDGDRQIDTAHLLHSLLDADPEASAVFADEPHLPRLLGYLVQRSIGYGLRWQGTVEDSGAVPVVTAAGTIGADPAAAGPFGADPATAAAEGFSPLAAEAMEYARVRAGHRDGGPARGVDLLAGILVDSGSRAVEVLARAGIDAGEVRARLDGLLPGGLWGRSRRGDR